MAAVRPMIEHVALRVTDLGRSIAFYRDVMGFAPAGRRRIAGGRIEQVVFRVGEDVLVLFHAVDGGPGESEDTGAGAAVVSDHIEGAGQGAWTGGMDHLAFCLPEAEYRAVLARLASSGGKPHRGEERNLGAFGVGYATYFHDPDGIEIEIKRYDDPPEQPGPEWTASAKALERRGR